jgi:hypothetical protein
MDGVAHRLVVAAQMMSDLEGSFSSGAGQEDLTTAQNEGIGRAQACLQMLALGVAQGTQKDRSLHNGG